MMRKQFSASKSQPTSPRNYEPSKTSKSKSGPTSPRGHNVHDSHGEIKVGDPPITEKSSNEKSGHTETPAGKGSIPHALKFFRSGKSTSFSALPTPPVIPLSPNNETTETKKKTAKVAEAKEVEELTVKTVETHRPIFGILCLDNLISEAKHPELYRRTLACTVLAQSYNAYIELLVKSQWHTVTSLKSVKTEKAQKLLQHAQEEQVNLMKKLCQIIDNALTAYLIKTNDKSEQVNILCEFLRERIDAVMGSTQFDNYPFVKGLSFKDQRHFFPKEINSNMMTMKRIQKKEYELRAEIQIAALDFLHAEKFNEPLTAILSFLANYVSLYHEQDYTETLDKLSQAIVQMYVYLEKLRIKEAAFDSAVQNDFTPQGFISFNSLLPEHEQFRKLLVSQIGWALKQKHSKPSCNPAESDFFISADSELHSAMKNEISAFTKGFKKTSKKVPKDLPKLAQRLAEQMLEANQTVALKVAHDTEDSRAFSY